MERSHRMLCSCVLLYTLCAVAQAQRTGRHSMSSAMASYDENRFLKQVDSALVKVRQILEVTRNPVYVGDVHHSYHDKFTVTELLVKTAIACNVHTLSAMGVSVEMIRTLLEWAQTRTVSLRFEAREKCMFDREESMEVDSAEKIVETIRSDGMTGTSSTKFVSTITNYFWKYEGNYELLAFRGTGADSNDQKSILTRTYRQELVTRAKFNPRYESKSHTPLEIDITWFFKQLIPSNFEVKFSINREDSKCRTPRRNPEVEKAMRSFQMLHSWSVAMTHRIHDDIFSVWPDHALDLSAINANGVFLPVLPFLESTIDILAVQEDRDASGIENTTRGDVKNTTRGDTAAATLEPADVMAFLAEHQRTIAMRRAEVKRILPAENSDKAISAVEGQLLLCLEHLKDVAQQLWDGLGYVENMLRKQLTAAVGRELVPADFAAYMRFHNRRLFRPEFEPRPFCYAIRRSMMHSPEGHVTIEEAFSAEALSEPVYTVVHNDKPREGAATMRFTLNAATTVRFGGERYLHAWMRHSFAGQKESQVFLTTQARQFSSFIVLIGTIVSPTDFEPKYGAIVQNKDDLRLPLLLDTLPSPKEFRDAIESLSPEQQAFARAFRSMQLANTIFAVCIIQIKPQLERLLNLPTDSLTKEIKLTQDLTELFIKYQIPADLLTSGTIGVEGDNSTRQSGTVGPEDIADKLQEVKRHVKAMHELIEKEKEKQMDEIEAKRRFEMEEKMRNQDSSSSEIRDRKPKRDLPYGCPSTPPSNFILKSNEKVSSPKKPPTTQQDSEHPSPGPKPAVETSGIDYVELPGLLDKRFEALDQSAALRSTTIRPADAWTKKSMAWLLSDKPDETTLEAEGLRGERGRAFELLDALTRGGALVLEEASLHVVLAATHGFDKGLVDTVVEDGVNPIDKAERSTLIMTSGVVGSDPGKMVREEHMSRLQRVHPELFVEPPPPAVA